MWVVGWCFAAVHNHGGTETNTSRSDFKCWLSVFNSRGSTGILLTLFGNYSHVLYIFLIFQRPRKVIGLTDIITDRRIIFNSSMTIPYNLWQPEVWNPLMSPKSEFLPLKFFYCSRLQMLVSEYFCPRFCLQQARGLLSRAEVRRLTWPLRNITFLYPETHE